MTTPASSVSANSCGPQPRDRWIPWYFVAFFVVLALLDGVFVYLATSTQTGVITKDSYYKGKDYNAIITSADEQDALGWNTALGFNAESHEITFSASDADGQPLSNATVTAYLIRPSSERYDFNLPLVERSPGEYHAAITFPLKGLWDLKVTTTWQQHSYQTHRRIIAQ